MAAIAASLQSRDSSAPTYHPTFRRIPTAHSLSHSRNFSKVHLLNRHVSSYYLQNLLPIMKCRFSNLSIIYSHQSYIDMSTQSSRSNYCVIQFIQLVYQTHNCHSTSRLIISLVINIVNDYNKKYYSYLSSKSFIFLHSKLVVIKTIILIPLLFRFSRIQKSID